MKTIAIVPIEFVHQAWQKCGYMIEAAMIHAKGECTADQLKCSLVNGRHQLMLFMEDKDIVGAVEFEINNFPNDRIFYINAIGGKVSKEHFNLMGDWAKQNGATSMRGCVRESVSRLLKMKHGCEPLYIMVEKRL